MQMAEVRARPAAKGESDCAICQFPCVESTDLSGCGHRFCFVCIEEWAKVTNTCPLCKARFSSLILSDATGSKTIPVQDRDQVATTHEIIELEAESEEDDANLYLDDEAEEVSDATAEREGEDEERELHELFGDSLHGPIHDLDEFDDDNDVDDDSEGSLADFIVRSSEESSEESTYDPGDEDLASPPRSRKRRLVKTKYKHQDTPSNEYPVGADVAKDDPFCFDSDLETNIKRDLSGSDDNLEEQLIQSLFGREKDLESERNKPSRPYQKPTRNRLQTQGKAGAKFCGGESRRRDVNRSSRADKDIDQELARLRSEYETQRQVIQAEFDKKIAVLKRNYIAARFALITMPESKVPEENESEHLNNDKVFEKVSTSDTRSEDHHADSQVSLHSTTTSDESALLKDKSDSSEDESEDDNEEIARLMAGVVVPPCRQFIEPTHQPFHQTTKPNTQTANTKPTEKNVHARNSHENERKKRRKKKYKKKVHMIESLSEANHKTSKEGEPTKKKKRKRENEQLVSHPDEQRAKKQKKEDDTPLLTTEATKKRKRKKKHKKKKKGKKCL